MPCLALFPFFSVVIWLLAFPMKGFLLTSPGLQEAFPFFIIPHAITLFAISFLATSRAFPATTRFATITTAAATALFPHAEGWYELLLACIGVAATFPVVSAVAVLRKAANPQVAAALALVGANLILLTVAPGAVPPSVLHPLLAAMLLATLFFTPAVDTARGEPLFRYLPFLFLFQMLSGMMYGLMMALYNRHLLVPGLELIFYILTVLAGLFLARRSKDLLLLCGTVGGMLAFSLLHNMTPLRINMSMWAMQGAAGFMDIFVLTTLLSRTRCQAASGSALGTVCAGIAAGHYLAPGLDTVVDLAIDASNTIMVVAVFAFVLFVRKRQPESIIDNAAGAAVLLQENVAPPRPTIPASLQKRLSDQERAVLDSILDNMTFRATAHRLSLSESSVKTYMKRIYEKTGVTGKEQLVTLLEKQNGSDSA